MSAEYHVGCGFSCADAGVKVAAEQPGRHAFDHLAPVFPLSDGLIAGGGVENYGCPGCCVRDTRRAGRPEILANLHTDNAFRQVACLLYTSRCV